jgi:hypothetical protein
LKEKKEAKKETDGLQRKRGGNIKKGEMEREKKRKRKEKGKGKGKGKRKGKKGEERGTSHSGRELLHDLGVAEGRLDLGIGHSRRHTGGHS